MFDMTLHYKYVDVVSIENFDGKTASEIYDEIIELQKDMVAKGELEAIDESEAEQAAVAIFNYLQEEQEGQLL